MASVPDPVAPEVQAQPVRPNDYEEVQTNPNQFGAGVGQAVEGVGHSLEQVGGTTADYAAKQQALFNEANVNKAQSDYLTQVNSLLYKPETSPGANDGGYYTKRGDAAFQAYESTQQSIDKVRSDALAALPSPRQQVMFDQLTRRLHDYNLQAMGRHADQELQSAADAKTQALISTVGQTATLAAASGDMGHFDEAVDQIKGAAQSWGDRKGYGSDWGTKYAQQQVGHVVQNTAEQMAATGNLDGASALVERYANQIDPASLLAVRTKLKGQLQDRAANAYAQNAVLGLTVPQGGPDLHGIAGQIINVEGTGKNPNSTAQGPGQLIDGTAIQMARATRPDLADKSDADVLQYVRSNPDVAKSLTENYTAQNAQTLANANLPVTPGNVYLAHFLGPQGAIRVLSADPSAPISSAVDPKAIAANPTILQGKTVGQVQQWATLQMAGVKPGTAVKMDKAQAISQAMTAFSDNPDMQKKVGEAINRQYAAVQLAAQADAAARTQASEDATNGYVQRMMKGDTNGIVDAIAKDQNLTASSREHLWSLAESHGAGTIDKDAKTYGPGFWDTYRAVTAPVGDPSRITDQNAILRMAGPQPDGTTKLSLEGVDKLLGVMRGKNTVDGEAETKMQAQAFNVIHRNLSGEDALPGQKDPQGERIFAHALPMLYRAIEAGKAKGIPAGKLFDPESPDFIGNSVKGLQRDPSQYYSDLVGTQTAANAKPRIDLTSRDGVVAAYQSGGIGRDEAAAALTKLGVKFQQPQPGTPAPQIPVGGLP